MSEILMYLFNLCVKSINFQKIFYINVILNLLGYMLQFH